MVRSRVWQLGRQEPEVIEDLVAIALMRTGASALIRRVGGGIIYAANMPDCWSLPTHDPNPTFEAIFGDDLGATISAAVEATIEATLADTQGDLPALAKAVQLSAEGPGGRHFDIACQCVVHGDSAHVVTTIVERTDEIRREKKLKALLLEVSHRSKNLLAIVLSIAAQTARCSMTLEGFLQRFNGRVHSLSRSQDLVTDASWAGAHLHDLICTQVLRYLDRPDDLVRLEGEDILLDPNEALHVGLALNELIVDAIARGKEAGHLPSVVISCTKGATLQLSWVQTGCCVAASEAETGTDTFGSMVLKRVTPLAIGGSADYSDDGEAVCYCLTFPADRDSRH